MIINIVINFFESCVKYLGVSRDFFCDLRGWGLVLPPPGSRSRVFVMQSKRWCFTINNFTDDDCAAVLKLCDSAVYLVCGQECGEGGTPHLQGFVVFRGGVRLKTLKKKLVRAHLEVARGTSAQNREYCIKEGNFEEFGECPEDTRISSESNRDNWQVAFDLAKAGRFSEIQPQFQIRYFRALQNIHDLYRAPAVINDRLCNIWIWGGSGVGKTKWVFDNFPEHYKKLKNKWWDGYGDEQVVVIQEFGKKHEMLSEHLKEWADHYPFRCERKGSSMVINFKVLIITSNYAPDAIWSESEVIEPILRRFNIFHMPDQVPSSEEVSAWKEYVLN